MSDEEFQRSLNLLDEWVEHLANKCMECDIFKGAKFDKDIIIVSAIMQWMLNHDKDERVTHLVSFFFHELTEIRNGGRGNG